MSEQTEHVGQQEEGGKQRMKGDERKQVLVGIAYQMLAEKGFEGLRVRDVAAGAGINIATLHYYFPTKEDLVREVVEHLLQQFLTVTAPVSDQQEEMDSPQFQMRQIFLDTRYQLEHMPEMFIVLNELQVRAQRDVGMRQVLQALNDRWQGYITELCLQGSRQGLFRSDLDPARAASQIIALVKGVCFQTVSHLETFDFEQIGNEVVHWLTAQ